MTTFDARIDSTFDSIVAIDAGNSRIKFGFFQPTSKSLLTSAVWPECVKFQAIHLKDEIPWGNLADWLKASNYRSVISGSNPRAMERVISGWIERHWPDPLVIDHYSAIRIALDVDFPDKVGLDRLLNAVAVNRLRPPDRAAIIINSGTATTVDYVSASGVFCGGSILPGLEMSAKALNHYTTLLPLLTVQELGEEPPIAPGRNTRDAIRNGLYWGQVGAIQELIKQICNHRSHSINEHISTEVAADQDHPTATPWKILTGGAGPLLSREFPHLLHLPSVGMHGLVWTAWQDRQFMCV